MDANIVDQYAGIEDLNNVINIDVTQAIYMDGQYYIPTNTKAILLPEDDSQYVINDTGDILLNDTNFEAAFDNTEIVHFIDDTQIIDDQNQIVYYTDEVQRPLDDNPSLLGAQLTFMDNAEPSLKKIRLEGEMINIDSLFNVDQTEETAENDETKSYQYIVQLENFDGMENSHVRSVEDEIQNSCNISNNVKEEPLESVDISKITGKNLLTGQRVTLHSYLEKVRNSNKELSLGRAEEVSQNIRKRGQHTALSNLLHKKLTIGKTLTGQKLVGKVIHVGKKETDALRRNEPVLDMGCLTGEDKVQEMEENSENDLSALDHDGKSHVPGPPLEEENPKETVAQHNELNIAEREPHPSGMSENMIEYISKTLTNLMSMESVSKKLRRKNLSIKVTERIITNNNVKVKVFQMRGYLQMRGGWEEEDEEYEEKWVFKLDEEGENNGDGRRNHPMKFQETMKLMISIVQMDGIIQTTKVNLNSVEERCSICGKEFRTVNRLRSHMQLVHQVVDTRFYCQLCDESIEGKDNFSQHRQQHVDKKELYACTKCDKHFLSEIKLTKHILTHDPESWKLTCTVCGEPCRRISSWRKHMLTHTDVKPYCCNQCNKQFFTLGDLNYHSRVHDPKNCYECKVCNRTFSRYSNLQRHSEIHGSKSSLSVYNCSICGCTYNYVSSLTRHIVQNHISAS